MKKLFLIINNDKFFLSHRKHVAIAAQEFGYDVTVVTGSTGLEGEIRLLGLRYIQLPINTTGMNIREEIQTFEFLINLYKEERPDIIHHVGLKPILWGTVAASVLGKKNVVNAVSGTGFLFSPETRNSLISKGVCFLLKIFTKKTYKYIFQNNDDKQEFLNMNIINDDQVCFIKGSGVDLQQFAYRSEDKIDCSRIKCVFTGRMVEDKGVLVIFEAARILKDKYNDKIRFILCGDLDSNPKALGKEEIESFCDGEYIQWLGFKRDIKKILHNCHIMIFPSFYMEGLPKSVIDAEAIGLPVITTDWVGCRDTVIDGYNGFIIPPKNSKILAEKIKILINDSELRKSMGRNSRIYAEEYFSIENVIEQHLNIYSSFFNEV